MSWELDWLANRARISPNRIAVVDGETKDSWTFEQVNQRADRVASHFTQQGVKKGDRIALIAPNHISYFDIYFACEKLGAIFVPLNWRLSSTEIQYIIRDCMPSVIAYHPDVEELIQHVVAFPVLNIESDSYEAVLAEERTFTYQHHVAKEDPLAIIYTGGTTGKPKGVVLTHQSIFCNSTNTVFSWGLTREDTTLTFMPMFHTGGLFALTMPLLHIGGKVVIGRKFEADKTVTLLNEEGCTIVLLVPTMHHMLTESKSFQDANFPTMHTFLSGGAPCSPIIYEAYFRKGLAFKEGYGLTEAGPNNFVIDPVDAREKMGSVGKPMLYNDVKLITETGEEAGPDEVGELVIKGYHVFDHYWNNPEQTKATKIKGWLHTGDIGRKDKDGFYYIVGRKKDMIITGGENVYPLEVEHIIGEHEAVSEIAVVGLPDDKWGEIVTAFVVLKQTMLVTEEELKAFCAKKLGGYKVPKKFVILDELPKTHVGKIDKKTLVD